MGGWLGVQKLLPYQRVRRGQIDYVIQSSDQQEGEIAMSSVQHDQHVICHQLYVVGICMHGMRYEEIMTWSEWICKVLAGHGYQLVGNPEAPWSQPWLKQHDPSMALGPQTLGGNSDCVWSVQCVCMQVGSFLECMLALNEATSVAMDQNHLQGCLHDTAIIKHMVCSALMACINTNRPAQIMHLWHAQIISVHLWHTNYALMARTNH